MARMTRTSAVGLSLLWLLAAVLVPATGCNNSTSASGDKPATSNDGQSGAPAGTSEEDAGEPLPAANADEVLEKMAAVYQQAHSYRDAGQVELRFQPSGDGQPERHDFDYSVAFVRPNQLRVKAQSAVVAADGERFRAIIKDEEKTFGDDVLDVECPAKIVPNDLMLDQVLASYLGSGMGGPPVQLVLLAADDPLKEILADVTGTELLPPEKYDGRWHHKIRLDRTDGRLVLWIDQRTSLLRRLEYPTEVLQQMFAERGADGNMTLAADFRDAKVDSKIDPALFEFEIPPTAKAVPRFNHYKLQPVPPAPSRELGKQVGEFSLTGLDGTVHTRESLSGKVVVLDFWATWCQPCLASLPNLQKVYDKYADNDAIQFLAVSVDESSVDNDALLERFSQIGASLPIARADAAALQALGLAELRLPNLLVLGPDGVLEDNEVGYNPALASELPPRLKQLLDGHSLHEETLARYDAKLVEYYSRINAPPEATPGDGAAAIAPRDEPKTVKLTQLWSTSDLTDAGNVLVVPQTDGPSRIFVHDGWRHVVELNAEGQTISRHALENVPADAVTAFLRTAVDAAGKRYYLALANGEQYLFLYDEQWQPLLMYPEESGHAGIADALLADIDADGELDLCVSYWGDVGVQRANLDGKRRWRYRDEMNDAYSMVLAPGLDGDTPRLVCANGLIRDSDPPFLAVLSAFGEREDKVVVPNQHLFKLAAADLNGDGKPEYCGLAPSATGNQLLLGFNLQGEELWQLALATGNHTSPVESITSGKLLPGDNAHWLVASPDGSVLFVAADGTLADSFHYGTALHGLAATEIDGQRVLLVSTGVKVEAWKVEP
ncbi:MAG: redoxin family protein [Pirellulales bacterium]